MDYLPVSLEFVPEVPDELAPLPLVDEPELSEAAGADDDFLAFLAFLCFLTFFFFGVWSVLPAVSVLPAAPAAAGWSVLLAPEVSLREPLPLVMPGLVVLDEPDAPLPMEPELPDDGEVLLGEDDEAPEAPLPMVPELPEESLLDDGAVLLGEDDEAPEAPLPMVPELPELPDIPEAPVLPDMPASFLFWLLDMLLSVEELVPDEVCANTTEDTDATRTKDSDRIVFDLMNCSLS
ncbi:hypothetical protein [Noviherbaspirillum sp. UKPF54]|uniref:hypothetical protein n=1 Tax=Noviherbaspirillum sp. UKPF54 TaxID=2601898 RepID=UPI00143CF1C8|nr:hypothetical protein [Noviherbaspirillum sp. UKPF54]